MTKPTDEQIVEAAWANMHVSDPSFSRAEARAAVTLSAPETPAARAPEGSPEAATPPPHLAPGTRVRVFTRGIVPREEIGVGTVLEPEGPLAGGTLVLVAMPPFDEFPAANWWVYPEQMRPEGGGDG